jgi:PLP dependent protein
VAAAVTAGTEARRTELQTRLDAVRHRIRQAAAAAGRSAAGEIPELIVVTKFFPASDVALLAGLGVRSVGENRDQEAAAKAAELAQLDLDWHFIGQLQTNKAKSVVRYAAAVHSVDRPGLVSALQKAMTAEQQRLAQAGQPARTPLGCLIQVDLDTRPAGQQAGASGAERGGADPARILELASLIAASNQLRLDGLMAVAPLGVDPAGPFERLAGYSRRLREDFPSAGAVSAGMSRDLEAAIAAGATHLRVGSDVLGPRPSLR